MKATLFPRNYLLGRLTHCLDGLDNLVSDDPCKRIDQNERHIVLPTHFRGESTNEVRYCHLDLVRCCRPLDLCFLLRNHLWLWKTFQLPLEPAPVHWEMQYKRAFGRADDFRSRYRYLCLAFATTSGMIPI